MGAAVVGRGWCWSVPELVLLVPLAWSRPRHQLEQIGQRRMVALALLGVVSIGNGVALLALIGSLLEGHEHSGGRAAATRASRSGART